jgi:hypothetical protein
MFSRRAFSTMTLPARLLTTHVAPTRARNNREYAKAFVNDAEDAFARFLDFDGM